MKSSKFSISTAFVSIILLLVSCATNQNSKNATIGELKQLKNFNIEKQKDLLVFETNNRDSAHSWCFNEIQNGRIAQIYFDKNRYTYICKSTDKSTVKLPKTEKLIELLDENGEFIEKDD